MNLVQLRYLSAIAATLIGLALPVSAVAQYVWLDERGVKHFSDMPPPSSVPANRILKQAGKSKVSSESQPATTTSTETTATATPLPKTGPTIAEQNAEFRKRRAEQAEKEKKAADDAKLADAKAKNCARARQYHRALESGDRIVDTDKNGERFFLTDQQRADEIRETKRILDDCK